jgi:hypothetical protein
MKNKILFLFAALSFCCTNIYAQGWSYMGTPPANIETDPANTNDVYIHNHLGINTSNFLERLNIDGDIGFEPAMPSSGTVRGIKGRADVGLEIDGDMPLTGGAIKLYSIQCPPNIADPGGITLQTEGPGNFSFKNGPVSELMKIDRNGIIHMDRMSIEPNNGVTSTLRFNSNSFAEILGSDNANNGPAMYMFNNNSTTFPGAAGGLDLWTNGASRLRIDMDGAMHLGRALFTPVAGNSGQITSLKFNNTTSTNSFTEILSSSDAASGPAMYMFNNTSNTYGGGEAGGLDFWTNNSSRFRIDMNGTMHLGRALFTPVAGNSGQITSLKFNNTTSTNSFTEILSSSDAASGPAMYMFNNTSNTYGGGEAGGLDFWTNNSSRFRIDMNGTMHLGRALFTPVAGNSGQITSLKFNNTTSTNSFTEILSSSDAASGPAMYMFNNTSNTYGGGEAGGLDFWTNNSSRLRINMDGKIIIGAVTAPNGYKLFVEEGILTERVRVAVKFSNEWADHVFAKNYDLKPLCEVENYISKNKHLPDVPSAEDVVKDGVDLGKMDAKLLQKIEELTLYVIQQQKEIENLKKGLKK